MEVSERPAFEQPFELWREGGMLHLVLAKGARVDRQQMKEFIRLIAALDPSGAKPVVMEYPAHVVVAQDARVLLRRVCGAQGHPVALLALDAGGRAQAELFKHMERPAFPFQVFDRSDAAFAWAREREKSTGTVPAADIDR